ncbi:MAG: response regulator transcription factor [Ignavibacteriae bacterium]|nr:response regulator transcription factor [Ignavibacteriota bacterium]
MRTEKPGPIKVLLVDDHPIVLSGLRNSLSGNPKFEIVGEASNGSDAIRLAKQTKPAVVLMDISLPEMNGLEATKLLKSALPNTQVLILSMHKSKEYVLETIRAGAQGYILKDSPPADLLEAIERVHSHGSFFSPSVEQLLIDEVRKHSRPTKMLSDTVLSHREVEVLRFIAEGLTSREIADKLHLSVRTIETQRKSVMSKLNLSSVAELTAYAINQGIVEKG